MRVFVAGATGAIGRQLVPRLIRAGHSVTGLTRSQVKAASLRPLGAEPVVADAFDEGAIRAAIRAAQPETVVHELTGLAGASDLRKFDRTFTSSNLLRTRGTDNLLAAARDVGVKRFVAQSYCGWPYARGGNPVKSESDPLDPDPPKELRRSLDAIRHLEDAVTTAPGIEGVVLRYGTFYGDDTGMFDAGFVNELRKRHVPLIGNGGAWWSFLHTEDAAEATVAALERGRGIYNIVDDEPAQVREWLPALAAMLGAKPPLRIPAWLARLVAGEHLVVMMTQTPGGSNDKAKRELAWRPLHPSWRQGFAAISRTKVAGELRAAQASRL
jgi:2-alkyl-3-oxoalkanoate reductase